MKKKVFIIIAIIIAVILLVPIPHRLKDGGSVEYKAILYTVKSVHQIDHNNATGYIDGTIIKILGLWPITLCPVLQLPWWKYK